MIKILIAGMGNVLRQDDGFGVEVAKRLIVEQSLPANVKIIEVGIGGIHLVQELMDSYDVLMIIDAVQRSDPPGTLYVLEAEVPDLTTWTENQRQDFLADMHYTTPSKAMTLAKALHVLPPTVFIIGCQPVEVDELGIGLSELVEQAATQAIAKIKQLVRQRATSDQERPI